MRYFVLMFLLFICVSEITMDFILEMSILYL